MVVETAAIAQWRTAGGEVLSDSKSLVVHDSRRMFVLLQSSMALDAACSHARQKLRTLNADPSTMTVVPKEVALPKEAAGYEDDHSDGSELQGGLVSRNVRSGKLELMLSSGAEHTAPDGTRRLLLPGVLSPAECEQLIAGGLVAMAGAFTRCGQTTLGISPALAHRTRLPQVKQLLKPRA